MTTTDRLADTEATITDEQKAEWSALHERMRELTEKKDHAEVMAAAYLRDHVEVGAMTPGEFGLPSHEALDAYRRACAHAMEAATLWAERMELHEQAEAHPYTAVVRARIEANR